MVYSGFDIEKARFGNIYLVKLLEPWIGGTVIIAAQRKNETEVFTMKRMHLDYHK